MYPTLHLLLMIAYAITPLIALGVSVYVTRRSKARAPMAGFIVTCCSGAVMGMALVVFHALRSGVHRVGAGQLLLSIYIMVGMLTIVKTLSWGTQRLLAMALRAKPTDAPLWRRGKRAVMLLARIIVLFALGLPYTVATLATFRPRLGATPHRFDADTVLFPAAVDRTSIAGYWMPASSLPLHASMELARHWASQSIIICHGEQQRSTELAWLIQQLTNGGYNVLSIETRGYGDSGGQWSSFGDLERRDVLGAVAWLKGGQATRSQQIMVLGIGSGGGAAIAAAADSSPQGQQISAVAVIGGFADLAPVMGDLAGQYFTTPVQWLLMHVAVPIASVHAGADLAHFSPGNLASQLWPRPLLVIHDRNDTSSPFDQGQALFERASLPKSRYFFNAGRSGVLRDKRTARILLDFFDTAAPLPII